MVGAKVAVRTALVTALLVTSAFGLAAPAARSAPVPWILPVAGPTSGSAGHEPMVAPDRSFEPGPPYWLGGPTDPASGRRLAPGGLTVDPFGYYSSEPAPVGVGDFGISSTGAAYTYNTTRFLATAHFGSWNAGPANVSTGNGNFTTIQLNVVVVLTHGKASADYWIQDVPFYNTSSHFITFEDNVWNFSGSSNHLPSRSVVGNGTIYGGEYYADGAASGLPGNGVALRSPANVSAEVVASDVRGLPYVAFLYNDGYGWVTYDNVTFPWTSGWTLRGFQVNGSSLNPFGLFNDAEWVIGGPGGGSGIIDESSNFTMDLEYYNGHNFEAVPNAYDFGSDTAENTANVVASTATAVDPFGTPGGRYVGGSGTLHALYGYKNQSIVNVTAEIGNATLLVNGSSVPYRGLDANLTLVPGTYRLTDTNGTPADSAKTVLVQAGQYTAVSFGVLSVEPASGRSDTTATAQASSFTPGSTLSITWGTNNASLCSGTVPPNGSYSCTFDVPLTANGTYEVTAHEDDPGQETAVEPFLVTTNLTLTLAADRDLTDAGGTVEFWANASLGYPPYASYRWVFGSDGSATTSTGRTNHTFGEAGDYEVNVTVTDQIGDLVSAAAGVVVNPDPTVGQPTASRSSADVGQSVDFSSLASGGSGGYTYAWSGLPVGCATDGPTATCPELTGVGNYSVAVAVNDTEGFEARSPATVFRVFAAPTLLGIDNLEPYTDAGQDVVLAAEVSNGSGRFTFNWSGLPSGCAPKTSTAEVSCAATNPGTLDVTVRATDSNGITTGSANLSVTVYPVPQVTVSADRPGTADAGQYARFEAGVTNGSGGFSYIWAGLPPGCATENSASLTCLMNVVGPFTVRAYVTDRSGTESQGDLPFTVDPTLVLGWVTPPPAGDDVGGTIPLAVEATGGLPTYAYNWSGLPGGCVAADEPTLTTCTPETAGTYTVNVTAEDANGFVATTASVEMTVHALPAVAAISAAPDRLSTGQSLRLEADVSGGTGNLSYTWTGLPGGCSSQDLATISCTPSQTGNFRISLSVTDSLGRSANGSVNVTVSKGPLGGAGSTTYLALAAIVVIGLGAVIALVSARKRRATRSQPPDGTSDEPSP